MAIINLQSGKTDEDSQQDMTEKTAIPSRPQRIINLKTGELEDVAAAQDAIGTPEYENKGLDGLPKLQPGIFDNAILGGATEVAAGFNNFVADLADTLGPDSVNALLRKSGLDIQVPALRDQQFIQRATTGGYIEGTPGRALRALGEAAPAAIGAGGLIRQLASKSAPLITSGARATTSPVQTVPQAAIQQMAKTTVAEDALLGGLGGAGASLGEDLGTGKDGEKTGLATAYSIAGSLLAPLAGQGVVRTAKAIAGKVQSLFTPDNLKEVVKTTANFSDDAAAKRLATAMVREGLGPEDAAARLRDLGPEAVPADLGNVFARQLRTAANRIPEVEGAASVSLNARQAGAGKRINDLFSDTTGTTSLNPADEIERLNRTLGPKISDLYAKASASALDLPKQAKNIINAKSGLFSAARKAANKSIATRKTLGEKIVNLDLVDEMKRAIDDDIGTAIRAGRANEVRLLTKGKRALIDDVDKAIPEYRQARDLYAGKADLEKAAEIGEDFFKMKSSDLELYAKTLAESEKRFFVLGAKKAISDKINDTKINADIINRLFSKRGDADKLAPLFENKASFEKFKKGMKQESTFALTRRALQGNSSTAQQAIDQMSAAEVTLEVADALSSPISTARTLGNLFGRISKKGKDNFDTEAWTKVGDILASKGMPPERLEKLLRSGDADRVKAIMTRALGKELGGQKIVPVVTGALSTQQERQQEAKQ